MGGAGCLHFCWDDRSPDLEQRRYSGDPVTVQFCAEMPWGGMVPVYQSPLVNRASPVLKPRTATKDIVREQQEEIIQEIKMKKEKERVASMKVTNAPPVE